MWHEADQEIRRTIFPEIRDALTDDCWNDGPVVVVLDAVEDIEKHHYFIL